MGFFDKAIKNVIKSPLGKAALVGGLSMTPFGKAGIAKLLPLLSKGAAMPLISKPLTSAATSYGLARLMRARNPEKAALYGALSTLPFLMAGANKEALALAKEGFTGAGGEKASIWDVLLNRDITSPSKLLGTSTVPTASQFTMSDINPAYGKELSTRYMPVTEANKINFPGYNVGDFVPSSVDRSGITTAENILKDLNLGRYPTESGFKFAEPNVMDVSLRSKPLTRGAAENFNYFTKGLGTGEPEVARTGMAALLPKTDLNILNALVPTLGGVYGARETDAQAWKRIKEQRKQQLAFMYGVDPEDIEGEMDNPYYNIAPPALDFKYANQGGIMNLEMGGDISGPGTGTSDSINAKVSDGEFIFTEKAVTNFGGGDRQKGAQRMYAMMNQLDPQSETPQEGMV